MLIYRGAGIMTLLMPIVTVLLLMWLWPDPSVKKGDVSLMQFLLGLGIGAAINTIMGLIINRKNHDDGVRHHFFYIPMQWPSLAIVVVCGIIGFIKH
ncbi:hypothetical protein AB6866_20635 [Rahnella inusitata]|uniref:hypothetical protein n=1 Tax=Rahnella inusitata TaxID=58169 RepID=UPI0039BDA5B2